MIVLADERGQRMVRLVCADSKATVTTIYNCGDEKSISEHTTHLIHLRWILNSWTEPHLKIPLAHQNLKFSWRSATQFKIKSFLCFADITTILLQSFYCPLSPWHFDHHTWSLYKISASNWTIDSNPVFQTSISPNTNIKQLQLQVSPKAIDYSHISLFTVVITTDCCISVSVSFVCSCVQCFLLGIILVPLRSVFLFLVLMVAWLISSLITFKRPLKGEVEPFTGWRR